MLFVFSVFHYPILAPRIHTQMNSRIIHANKMSEYTALIARTYAKPPMHITKLM